MATSSFSSGVSEPNRVIRLAAVHDLGVLDTPPEAVFDDAVLIATQTCQAPMGSVGFLVEGRHWFKAKIGFAESEIPAGLSICAYTVQQPGLTVIPDLREHPEFRHNPFVTGAPGLRFYAGIALRDGNGFPYLRHMVCGADAYRHSGVTIPWETHPAQLT